MNMDAFHPDHLKPGDMVGPWRIVESLGTGNFGHTFKVELEGELFTLKMAVRPAAELSEETLKAEEELEKWQVDGRMCHEGAILLANTRHPGLPHLRAVGRWPHFRRGYFFIVTDYVPGEPFHQWRERTRPGAAQLVDIFVGVVRGVGRLHDRGIFIRDFKSEYVIISSSDSKPVVVDMGSAWLPGGSSLTVGLAPMTPHTMPPECVAFLRESAGKQGARFSADEAGDLYQLGVFMYEALTECWPFDPRLRTEDLLAAIQTVLPRAPHRLNPAVPPSLSHIVMRLLEKRPEDRYESAEALLQALWDANKERSSRAWRVSLALPPEGPAPMSQDEMEERRLALQEAERRAQEARKQEAEELSREQTLEELSATILELGARAQAADVLEAKMLAAEEKAAGRRKLGRRIALAASPLLLGLVLVSVWSEWRSPAPLPEMMQAPPAPEQQTRASSLAESAATEFLSAPEPLPTHAGITAQLPAGPLPGQRTPPCKRPQIEINGGCWIRVDYEAPPCVTSTYEWKKRCYFAVPAPPRPSTSGLKDETE
jgi:eukaryotic-like serine/threonine-protein kinase